MNDFNFIAQGWECPKCKRVYSPTTMMCIVCPQTTVNTNLTTGTVNTSNFHNFQEGEGSSKTKCKICGLEKWQHATLTTT